MQKDNYYGWVREVVLEQDVEKVNELLSKGYQLLSIKEKVETAVSDKGTYQKTSVLFILGKGFRGQADPSKVWKKNPDGTEWAYVRDVPEDLRIKAEKPFVMNGYIYWLSTTKKTIKKKPLKQQT
mgnify:CR=1 FL=1